jgi:hypothetical protein
MTTFTEAIAFVDHRLTAAKIPYAIGGALALMYCTGEPRTTADIDVNLFVPTSEIDRVLQALEPEVIGDKQVRRLLQEDGQARLFLDQTALDLFFSTTPFHEEISKRVVHHDLWGKPLPFLSCTDLAVFKAFFNRRKDWADLEAMVRAGSLNIDEVLKTLHLYLGDDGRVKAFQALIDELNE